jgi:hypothetical protein
MTPGATPSADNSARSSIQPIDEHSHAGLRLLLHAYSCALSVGEDSWDFAVEIERLYVAGLTISDLRWLVAKRFVDHGQELSVYGDRHRSFRPGAGYFFMPTTCVVLTASGATFADHFLRSSVASSPLIRSIETVTVRGCQISELENDPPTTHSLNGSTTAVLKPCWDSRLRELSLDGIVIKRFRVPAHIQQLILSVFQEEGWPDYIDDPLPGDRDIDPHQRLHDAIHRLNGHQSPHMLRFRGNGDGTGVFWELSRLVASRRRMVSGTE